MFDLGIVCCSLCGLTHPPSIGSVTRITQQRTRGGARCSPHHTWLPSLRYSIRETSRRAARLELEVVRGVPPLPYPLGREGGGRRFVLKLKGETGARRGPCLKVPCSYELTAMGKFTLLRYLSEFRIMVSSF